MKTIISRTVCGTVFSLGFSLGLLLAASSANARANVGTVALVKFSGPVSLPGVTLEAGIYRFELASSVMNHDLVRVMDKEGHAVLFSGFTGQVTRPAGMPADRQISLGDAPAGTAPPITAWFPNRDSIGYRFVYRTR